VGIPYVVKGAFLKIKKIKKGVAMKIISKNKIKTAASIEEAKQMVEVLNANHANLQARLSRMYGDPLFADLYTYLVSVNQNILNASKMIETFIAEPQVSQRPAESQNPTEVQPVTVPPTGQAGVGGV